MNLTYTGVYIVVGLLTYDLLMGRLVRPWRIVAAAFWPVTVALTVVAGVLVLPLALLALIGHAISWYRRLGPWKLRPQ